MSEAGDFKKVILKPGREKSLRHAHPWIFSGAIARLERGIKNGETVAIYDHSGHRWGSGAFSTHSQIAIRVWSFDPAEPINQDFFRRRLRNAIARREILRPSIKSNALRLVNAESDGLPGLIVDRYADYLVCQFLSAGAEYWRMEIVQILADLLPVVGIYERSDVDVRQKEQLPLRAGVLQGEEPLDIVEIVENGIIFGVDVKKGHKTGFYLDQRENRQRLLEFVAGRSVLNCFAYTGGFGIYALKGGAQRLTNIDSSAESLALLEKNLQSNGLPQEFNENVVGDAFQILRQFYASGRSFDLIVLDPPKFAESKQQILPASRGYKDINLLAFKLLRPGGILFTFSCSGQLPPELFQKIVADAALDAKREVRFIGRLTQAADHVVDLQFPEGSYLKGLICLVD